MLTVGTEAEVGGKRYVVEEKAEKEADNAMCMWTLKVGASWVSFSWSEVWQQICITVCVQREALGILDEMVATVIKGRLPPLKSVMEMVLKFPKGGVHREVETGVFRYEKNVDELVNLGGTQLGKMVKPMVYRPECVSEKKGTLVLAYGYKCAEYEARLKCWSGAKEEEPVVKRVKA